MNLVLMGGGKYAGILCAMFAEHFNILGYFDDVSPDGYLRERYKIKYLGPTEKAASLLADCSHAAIAIGSEGDLSARIRYFSLFRSLGFHFPPLVHSSAHVGQMSSIGQGTVIQYNALVHPAVQIGENCVISSRAIIGHDSVIGNNVYIGPGVIINGSVTIGDETFLGTGSIVIQKNTIGKRCTVAAATCVVTDVPNDSKVKGVPGKYWPVPHYSEVRYRKGAPRKRGHINIEISVTYGARIVTTEPTNWTLLAVPYCSISPGISKEQARK